MRTAGFACLLPLLLACHLSMLAGELSPSGYGPGRKLCELASPEIDESSGLACSRRYPGVFWTHNDSGDDPRLFAFNRKGEHLATIAVHGAIARDWEDMASFTLRGKPWLLIGDIGDNAQARPYRTLYLVPEPRLDLRKRGVEATVKIARAIEYTYAEGPQNCEAVAFDPETRQILVITKTILGHARAYAVPTAENRRDKPWVVKPIATLTLPAVVAMDVSPDGRRAIVLTYAHACEYTRRPDEAWADAFARAPRIVPMPRRRQGESICYGRDGKALYLTSEKTPTPLLEVPLRREGEAPAEPALE